MTDQRSLTEQLDDLSRLAVEHGLYDADDWLRATRNDRGCRHQWLHADAGTGRTEPPPTTPCSRCGLPYEQRTDS